MIDRYLFRGRRIDNGEWVIGCYLDRSWVFGGDDYFILVKNESYGNEGNPCVEITKHKVDPETVGQCTGLDVPLFENDKFELSSGETLICEYHNGGFGWWQYKGESYQYFIGFSDHNYLKEILEKIKITGTTHDNPEEAISE